jgi:alkylhydroperoxidase family enzyme
MAFLETPDLGPDAENMDRAFALRPDVYEAWRVLATTVSGNMDFRMYELATLAAARRLRSSYCSLAHGSKLAEQVFDWDTVREIASGDVRALDERDVAVMRFADQVVADATSITQADIDRLREVGLTDEQIFDVAAAAGVRCFFSKVLDAVGAQPDAKYAELDPAIRDVLVVGRPIASA